MESVKNIFTRTLLRNTHSQQRERKREKILKNMSTVRILCIQYSEFGREEMMWRCCYLVLQYLHFQK